MEVLLVLFGAIAMVAGLCAIIGGDLIGDINQLRVFRPIRYQGHRIVFVGIYAMFLGMIVYVCGALMFLFGFGLRF